MSTILHSEFVALARRYAAALLVLACAAAPGCKAECPPNTVQSGKFCYFKHDAGDDVAANGGSAADLEISGWSCTSVGLACVCKQEMTGPHGCSEIPPCCFTSTDAGVQVCECWPTNSSECASAQSGQRPGAEIVAHCPPR